MGNACQSASPSAALALRFSRTIWGVWKSSWRLRERSQMPYELYYWPGIQGRGEFVRLALEEAGADYIDVARGTGKDQGVPAVRRLLEGKDRPHYAPPILKAGRLVISQTANILLYLGEQHGLAPANTA